MQRRHSGYAEDYTTANLVLIFVNMLWIFVVIWAHAGLVPVILLGWYINHLINRLQASREARDGWSPSDA